MTPETGTATCHFMDFDQQTGLGALDFDTAFRAKFQAEPQHIDELGHVNNVVYLDWAQQIATQHWRHVSPPEHLESDVWVALRHEVDYRDAAMEGDILEARTWLGEISGVRFARHVDLRKPGATRFSARILTWWCRLDRTTRKPKRIDAEVLSAFGLNTR